MGTTRYNTAGVFAVTELFDGVAILDVGIFAIEVFPVTDEVFVVAGGYFVVVLVFAISQISDVIPAVSVAAVRKILNVFHLSLLQLF